MTAQRHVQKIIQFFSETVSGLGVESHVVQKPSLAHSSEALPTPTTHSMKNKLASYIGAAFTVALTAPTAFGALTLTNGNFETGGGATIDDVTGWLDPSNGTYWQGTWVTNITGISPNDTNVVVLGSFESGGTQGAASADARFGNHLYQAIGTKAIGDTTLEVDFQYGQPDDDPGGRQLGVTVAIYGYDGIGTFVAANDTNLYTASQTVGSGVTLLDFESFQFGTTTTADQALVAAQAALDITGAGSQMLYLSFNNYRPANTQSWSVIDNVSITAIPEPSAALLGGLGMLVMLRRRRG
jgi:hypothetical protein